MTDRDAGSLRPRVGWWERLRLLPSPALRAYERRRLGNKDARAGSLTSASKSASSSAYATPRRPAHAPLRAPVAMSPARRPGRSSARIPVAPWRLTHPAIRPQQFDHAHALWQDRCTMRGALSALCQGRDRSAARSAVTDNGSYVAYTLSPMVWLLRRLCSPRARIRAARAAERTLTEALELLQREAELPEDLVEEGRPDLSSAMDGNRHGPAIGMVPPLLASGLSTLDEAELTGHPLELPRGGARHSRFRSYPRAAGRLAPDTPRRSCRRRDSTPPRPLLVWPSGRDSRRWPVPRPPTSHRPGGRARSCRRRDLGGSRGEDITSRDLRVLQRVRLAEESPWREPVRRPCCAGRTELIVCAKARIGPGRGQP